jgi:hypothetical protein
VRARRRDNEQPSQCTRNRRAGLLSSRRPGHRRPRYNGDIRRDEGGNAALVTVFAMAITLIIFMAAINLIVDEYGKGAVRTAVDEAAQAGSLQGTPGGPLAACQAKATQVMSGLLNGPFGHGIHITCTLTGGQVTATADGNLPAWLAIVPVDTIHVVGSSPIETNP